MTSHIAMAGSLLCLMVRYLNGTPGLQSTACVYASSVILAHSVCVDTSLLSPYITTLFLILPGKSRGQEHRETICLQDYHENNVCLKK